MVLIILNDKKLKIRSLWIEMIRMCSKLCMIRCGDNGTGWYKHNYRAQYKKISYKEISGCVHAGIALSNWIMSTSVELSALARPPSVKYIVTLLCLTFKYLYICLIVFVNRSKQNSFSYDHHLTVEVVQMLLILLQSKYLQIMESYLKERDDCISS